MGGRSLIACAVLVVAFLRPASAETLESLRAGLEHARRSFTSVRGTVRQTTSHPEAYYRLAHAPRQIPSLTLWTADWAAKGAQVVVSGRTLVLDPSTPAPPGSSSHTKWASYDGSRYTSVDELQSASRPQEIALSSTRRLGGTPLDYGYTFMGDWYADILAAPGFHVVSSERDSVYGELTVVRGVTPRGVNVTVRFAKDRGYLAVAAEETDDSKEADRCNGYTTVNRADEVKLIDGMWVPTRGTYEWRKCENGEPVTIELKHFTLSNVSVGHVRDALFTPPAYKAGSLVRNDVDKKDYLVDAEGKLVFWGNMGNHSGTAPQPARALGWLFIASVAALLMAAAMRLANWRRGPTRS